MLARPVNQYYLLNILAHVIKGQALCSESVTPLPSPPKMSRSSPLATEAGRRILLVDDNEFCRSATSRLLTKYGAKIKVCEDGIEALDQIKNGRRYDMAIVDYQMPRMDGLSLIREVRTFELKEKAQKLMPIIRMTGENIK